MLPRPTFQRIRTRTPSLNFKGYFYEKNLLLFFLFCIQGTAYSSQDNSKNDQIPASPPSSINELQEQLEKVLQDTHLPGMSVAIVQRDGPNGLLVLVKLT